jgi:hypothetical protein
VDLAKDPDSRQLTSEVDNLLLKPGEQVPTLSLREELHPAQIQAISLQVAPLQEQNNADELFTILSLYCADLLRKKINTWTSFLFLQLMAVNKNGKVYLKVFTVLYFGFLFPWLL